MNKKLTDEEYYKSLPKKQVGTAVLFFNDKQELLILKPNYKAGWLVPGGLNDERESPLQCAIRETQEEIGLSFTSCSLVGVYHSPGEGFMADSLKFIFSGGVLSDEQIKTIKLQNSEFDDMVFMNIVEAVPLLSKSLQKSIPQCIEALGKNSVAYNDA
jgi:8-oxo-dGTP diphosphatase